MSLPDSAPLRIGAVNYLNSKPLIYGFDRHAAQLPGSSVTANSVKERPIRLSCDLPSRLADSLAAGRLDVALVPSFEFLANPAYERVSDACVAAEGPVASVKLYFRKRPEEVKRIALDEGSRTSASLSRVLLKQRYNVEPVVTPLPIGSGPSDTHADAFLLIGDRAMEPLQQPFAEVWDLGEEWQRDTGLPFVFACWAAQPSPVNDRMASLLNRCRDDGLDHLKEIAAAEAPALGLSMDQAERYLRENLRFVLGEREQQGLDAFRDACLEAGLLTPAIAI